MQKGISEAAVLLAAASRNAFDCFRLANRNIVDQLQNDLTVKLLYLCIILKLIHSL